MRDFLNNLLIPICLGILVPFSLSAQGTITGTITDLAGVPVEGVRLTLTGDGPAQTSLTDASGVYTFSNLPEGSDYVVTPADPENCAEPCITIADNCLVSNWLNNAVPMTALQYIAADINDSELVTQSDNSGILGYLLGNGPIPGSCYRFIPTSYTFPNPQNPWQAAFPELDNVPELEGTQIIDFHAVRRGDPTGCSTPAMAEPGSLELGLTASVNETMNGDFFCVQVVAQNYTNLTGFSATLNWEGNMTQNSITGFAPLQDFGDSNVIPNAAENRVSVFYLAPTVGGADLPSPSTLFEVCFVTDGFAGDNLDFELTGNPSVPGSSPSAAAEGCIDQLVTGFGGGGPIVLTIPVGGGDGGMPLSLMCPENFTGEVTTEDCMGQVSLPALGVDPVDGDYSITNNYNGSFDASGLYPVGTTNVTYTVTDNVTLEMVECSFTVTINDPEDCLGQCTNFNPEFVIGAYDETFGTCLVDVRFVMSDLPGLATLQFLTTSGEFAFQALPSFLSAEVEPGNMEVNFVPNNGNTDISLGAYNDAFGSFDLTGFDVDAPAPVITVTAFNPDGGVLCSETFTYDCVPPSVRDCEDLGVQPGISMWQALDPQGVARSQGGPSANGASDSYLRLSRSNENRSPWVINMQSYGTSFVDDLGDCLCFDVYVRDQQPVGTVNSYTPTFRLYRGDNIEASNFYATFTAHKSITAADGWQRICIPLANCSGGLPSNDDGNWSMTSTGDPCVDWNALIMDFNGIGIQVNGELPGLRMGIDEFCFEECNISEASSCEATITNDANDQCCPSLSFSNNGSDQVTGVRFTLLDGVTFNAGLTNHPTGYDFFDETPVTRVVAQIDPVPFGANVDNLLNFCMLDVDAPTQRMVVEYLAGENLATTLCTDTLTFSCPVQNYCLDVSSDTLVCAEEGDGYRLQLNVVVPDNNYTDDVGRVKVILPGLMEPILYDFPMPLTAGESYGIDTLLTGLPLTAGDSLKVLVSAHDGPEERLCCFADSLCLPVPLCNPCDLINVYATPDVTDSCCYYLVIDNQMPIPGYFDSLVIDTVEGFVFGAIITDTEFWMNDNWVGGNNQNQQLAFTAQAGAQTMPGIDTILYFCQEETFAPDSTLLAISSYSNGELACIDTTAIYCPAELPCDSLSATLQRTESDTCAYDLYLDNTFTADPDLITSVTVNIISGPEANFSGANLIPTAPGWDFATGSGGSYTLNPTDGAMPLGSGQQVFRFNIENSFSADSTYVEVAFLSGMDTLCRDTLVGVCPGCITIPEEQILCDEDHYLYRFTFVNHSPYPVNAVRVLETEAPNGDALLNGQTHFLPEMVPVGGTYTGFLPVEFADDGDGEFCFDIVLRQVVDGELPINCCFATLCIELPDCSPASPERCVVRAGPPVVNTCPLEYLPVCGCDGNTYVNICYAEDRGVLNYTQGACPNTPPILPNFPIDDITPIDGTVVVGTPVPFPVPDDLPDWDGFILQHLRVSDNSWWQLGATRDIDEGQISLTDDAPVAGEQTYRIIGVLPNGRPYLSQEATVDVPAMRANITLSPNPATDAVWLQSARKGPAEVEVISATGQRGGLQSVIFGDAPVRLNLGRRSVGVHTVVVRFTDGSWGSRRVVLK